MCVCVCVYMFVCFVEHAFVVLCCVCCAGCLVVQFVWCFFVLNRFCTFYCFAQWCACCVSCFVGFVCDLCLMLCAFMYVCSLSLLKHGFVLLYMYTLCLLCVYKSMYTMCVFCLKWSLLFNAVFDGFRVVFLLLDCLCVFVCVFTCLFVLLNMRLLFYAACVVRDV